MPTRGLLGIPGTKIFAASLLAAALLICRSVLAQVSPVASSDLPVPPGQTQPWTAPASTSLPAVVVSAATALFDGGMADPRGCEYREVEILLNSVPSKEHGWVLPTDAGARPYAIGWNGVIYPVKSVGAPVDLARDLAALAGERFRGNGNGWPMSDRGSLAVASALPVKVALLLRLGQTTQAETLWQDGSAGDQALQKADPYPDMAAVWLGRWYNRAVEAYLHDDYPAALFLCGSLSPVLAKARETARARGNPDPWPAHRYGETLWQLPALAAEAERRIHAPPYPSVFDSGKPAAGPERVAALIRELEQVHVSQLTTPGETDVLEDPVLQALVEEGGAAVPALLKCLVEDQRLTRSRHTEGMSEDGPIIPVYEGAYRALFSILNVSLPLFEHDDEDQRQQKEPRDLGPDDRQALATKLASAWQKTRGRNVVEAAYNTLRDDNAGEQAWLQAVDDIVQPDNGIFTDYRLVPPAVGGYSMHINDDPFTPRGEALRARTDPLVTELMIRRFGQLSESGLVRRGFPSGDLRGKLLLSLAGWDGKGHLDDLRRLQREIEATYHRLADHPPERDGQGNDLYEEAKVLILLFEKRVDLGDATALADYAGYLQTLTPKTLGTTWADVTELFRLMWRHPDEPAIARASEKMFGAGSPWVPLVRRDTHELASLMHSPLVAVPAFARELDRGLGDPSNAGQAVLEENGYLNGNDVHLYSLDPLAPPKGSVVHYRLCDYYAHALSFLDGFPQCELYWPQANRDRAVEACRVFLHRYGGNFRYQEKTDRDRDRDVSSFGFRIHLPVLDHPATPEDVEAGRAIFSLPAPSRVCRLPDLPLSADRPGRREDPGNASDGEGHQSIQYETRGQAWQAEETLVDGRWERYYGFVGRYQLEKVPAAEIQFPSEYLTHPITPEISGRIDMTLHPTTHEFFSDFVKREFVPVGAPVPVQVKVRNHAGLDQTLPSVFLLPPGEGKGTLPPGIQLSLEYSEKLPPRVERFREPPFDYGTWRKAPLREGARVAAKGEASSPVLNPGQELIVLDIDLRDYFDLSRAGSYRLKVLFHMADQAETPSNEVTFSTSE